MESWKDILSPRGQAAVANMAACRNAWNALLAESPDDLANLVAARCLESSDQTFATETLGFWNDPKAKRVLLSIIFDPRSSPLDLEGALYGLYSMTDDISLEVIETLESHKSEGLQKLANVLKSKRIRAHNCTETHDSKQSFVSCVS